jgi:hypothetical protein
MDILLLPKYTPNLGNSNNLGDGEIDLKGSKDNFQSFAHPPNVRQPKILYQHSMGQVL